MNGWTEGVRIFNGELGKLQGQSTYLDRRGCEHHFDIKENGQLYHSIMSSRPVKGSWLFSKAKLMTKVKVVGAPSVIEQPNGGIEVWACRTTKGKIRLWARPEEFPDPAGEEEEPDKPPALKIKDGQFCYLNDGTVPIKFKGAAMREALLLSCGWNEGWTKKSLEWYEQEVLAYYADQGYINLVRTDTCEAPKIVAHHAEFCYDHGIIWMANLFDRDLPNGDVETNINILAPYPNIILQAGNELLGDTPDEEINKMVIWIREINESKIGISAGGAFGAGGRKTWEDKFLPQNPRPAVWAMHRPYDANDPTDKNGQLKKHIKWLKEEFKTPVAWDEAHSLHADEMRSLAEVAFGAGLDAFCFYVFYKNYVEEKPPKVDPFYMYYIELGNLEV